MSELYELPNEWEWKTLGESYVVKDGTHDSPKYIKEDGYPLFTSKNLKDYGIDTNNYKLINEEDYQKINKRSKVDKGDLLFAMIGTIGNPTIVDFEPNFAIKNVALFKPKSIDNTIEILRYYFSSNTVINKMINEAKGATQKFVGLTYLRSFPVPNIPLPEQKRIVSKLDTLFEKIDKAIALHQKNMDEADVFMGSVLNDVFGELEDKYEKRTVEELCTKITDGTHATPTYIDSGTPFLSVKNISKGIISFDDTKFVSNEEHSLLSKRCNVERDDILYTKVGTTGIAKVVDTDKEFSIFVSIALLKPKKDLIISMFFQYILNSPNCYEQSQSRTRGVANRNLVLRDIKQINFPVPPQNIQQKVVTYLDQISEKTEKVKSVQKEKMESLKALKASLLDRAFRGEL